MQVSIKAEHRSDFGKGAARRTRREGRVPAVIYGKGHAPQHVALPDHDLSLALRHPGLVLEVSIEGQTVLAAARDVQRDAVKRTLEHVDLVVVSKAEARELIEAGLAAEAAAEAAHEAEQEALRHLGPEADMDLEAHLESEGGEAAAEAEPEA